MGRCRKYILKNYDTPLIEFEVSEDSYKNLSCTVTEVNDDGSAQRQLPVSLLGGRAWSGEAVLEWMRTRTVPKNRRFVDKILAYSGLEPNDTLGLMDLCKGLSVNDAFWVAQADDGLDYEKTNLYENDLDEALAVVAYTGYDTGQRRKAGLSTEWTTSGQFPKAWRRIGGRLVLYKAGSEGFANAGNEPFSEYLASQVAQAMGIKAVEYGLDRWHGKLASTCGLLNGRDVGLVPFHLVTGQSEFPRTLGAATLFGKDAFEALRTMTVFDSLIANIDRHAANYGFLRDNRTGLLLGPAPLYDHNLALFPYDMPEDYGSWRSGARAGNVSPRTGTTSFDEQASFVMGEAQHEQLRRLLGFSLANHPTCPIPEDRLEALDEYLKKRVGVLLRMPVARTESIRRDFLEMVPADERRPPALMLDGSADARVVRASAERPREPAADPRREKKKGKRKPE